MEDHGQVAPGTEKALGMNDGEAKQLRIFEKTGPSLSVQDATRSVKWSYSRRAVLEQCSRRYYYQYFGANKNTAKKEPAKEMIHFLKTRVQSRYLVSGSALHTVIKTYFFKARQGDRWDADRLVGFAKKIYGESWQYSQQHPDGKISPAVQYLPSLLQEYYYEVPESDQLCAAEEKRLLDAVRSFATNELYQTFRSAGCENISLVEEKVQLANFPCKASGKIDLAFTDERSASVLDWKLGHADGVGDESLQLAFYALWAVDHFQSKPEDLRLYKVHLASNEIVYFPLHPEILASARTRILQDAERMSFLESYGSGAVVEAFSRCEKPLVCRDCLFRSVCHA